MTPPPQFGGQRFELRIRKTIPMTEDDVGKLGTFVITSREFVQHTVGKLNARELDANTKSLLSKFLGTPANGPNQADLQTIQTVFGDIQRELASADLRIKVDNLPKGVYGATDFNEGDPVKKNSSGLFDCEPKKHAIETRESSVAGAPTKAGWWDAAKISGSLIQSSTAENWYLGAKTIIHEVSHRVAKTLDNYYYDAEFGWYKTEQNDKGELVDKPIGSLESTKLMQNADSYAWLATQLYVNAIEEHNAASQSNNAPATTNS
jgi:hypothetical protein